MRGPGSALCKQHYLQHMPGTVELVHASGDGGTTEYSRASHEGWKCSRTFLYDPAALGDKAMLQLGTRLERRPMLLFVPLHGGRKITSQSVRLFHSTSHVAVNAAEKL